MSRNREKEAINAVRTHDGLIEVTSLDLLDALVGGYVNPEEVYCEVEDMSISNNGGSNQEGVS